MLQIVEWFFVPLIFCQNFQHEVRFKGLSELSCCSIEANYKCTKLTYINVYRHMCLFMNNKMLVKCYWIKGLYWIEIKNVGLKRKILDWNNKKWQWWILVKQNQWISVNKSGHWAVHLHWDCSGLTYDQEWTSKWISVETVDFSGDISVNKSGFQSE